MGEVEEILSAEYVLEVAVQRDHPCKDYAACDIATALRAGFTYSAAWLLMGATETPRVDAALAAFPEVKLYPFPPDWEAWVQHHRTYGIKCEACEGYTYHDGTWTPEQCAQCLAPM